MAETFCQFQKSKVFLFQCQVTCSWRGSGFFQVTCRRGALDSSKSSNVNQCHWKHKKEKKNSKQTQTEKVRNHSSLHGKKKEKKEKKKKEEEIEAEDEDEGCDERSVFGC